MSWRNTLILAVIAIAGVAYFRFFEMKRPSTEEARQQAQNLVNFDRNKIDGIVIKNGDQQIEIRRRESKWRLETPIKDQADSALVENLLSDLETWEKEGTIPAKDIEADKSKLTEYGLNNPKLKLRLLGQGRPPEIWFGKDAALEGRMYVRLQNSKETFLARQSIRKDIDKKPEEFRDRKLTDLTTAQVRRIILKTPAGEMELEKKGDHWNILKPLRARADDQKVGDLISQITSTRIQQFVADDRGDLRPYGLAEPRGSITLFDEPEKKDQKVEIGESIKVFGREDKGQMLQIGGVPEKEKRPDLRAIHSSRIRLHAAEKDRRDPKHKTGRSARQSFGSDRHEHSRSDHDRCPRQRQNRSRSQRWKLDHRHPKRRAGGFRCSSAPDRYAAK